MQKSQPKMKPRRSVIHRLVRVLVKIVMTILIILVLVIILIQTPPVQNIIRSKAESYLSRKLKTRVGIGGLYIKFPKDIVLKNLYIGDRKQDTLLSAGLVDVDIHMWGLLHNELSIHKIQLSDLTAKVKRQLPDTAFNFQFIIDAFAGAPDPKPAEKPSKPMKMSLETLVLDRIRLVYKDVVTGNDVEVWIDHSQTDMPVFDPTAMHFAISRFMMKGLRASVRQDQPLLLAAVSKKVDSAAAVNAFRLDLGKIDLQDSRLEYLNNINAIFTSWQVGQLGADVRTFDLNKQVIVLNELHLDSSNAVVRMGPAQAAGQLKRESGSRKAQMAGGKPKTGVSATAADSTAAWRFMAGSIRFNGDNIQFDDNSQPRVKKGMDFAHLNMKALTLHAADLAYNKDSISGRLTKGSLQEQSGFRLDELHTAFLYTNRQTMLKDLLLRTPGTLLQRSVSLRYSSLAGLMKDPSHTLIDLDMPNSRIGVKDILTFVPSLAAQPAFRSGDTWLVNTRVNGSLSELHIQTLQFSGIRDLRLDLSGTIHNPLLVNKVSADILIQNISGSRAGLVSLLPKGTLPANITLPSTFDLRGKISGGMAGFHSDMILRTSSGTLVLKGSLLQFRDPKNASYDLALQTKDLDLGTILQDSLQWGRVTADFTAKGRGFDPQTANARLHGLIHSAVIRKYDYKEFLFDGSIADHHLELQSSIQNTAVSFNLKASGDLANKYPALQLDWQIDTLDLHALHFVKDTLQFKGHLGADFASTNPDSLDGQLKISQIALVSGQRHFNTDSITLIAQRKGDIQDLQLHSEMADLDWNGRYKLTEAAQAIQHTINDYYRLNGFKDTVFTAQDWQMQLHLRPSPLVLAYMPSMKGTDSAYAFLSFNSDRDDLRLTIDAPKIQLGTQSFLNTTVTAATTPATAPATATSVTAASGGMGGPYSPAAPRSADSSRQLKYRVQIGSGKGSGFALHQTSLQGYLANNKLFTTLLLKDGKAKDRYRVAGQLDKLEDGLKFALNPDSLLLNYDQWQVSRDNFFQYDSAGIIVNDFKISNKDESLQIASTPPAPSSPVELSFSNFKLSTLSRFAEQDSLGVEGLLNGKAEVKNVMSSPIFTSDLKIAGLSYKKDTVGDVAIQVDNKTANAFAADITLQGNKNDVEAKGMYYTGEGKMDMKLDLRQLNLASIKPFSADQIQDIRGFLKGALTIKGTLDKPEIAGKLHFDSTRIVPVITGEPLLVSNDNIDFDADGFNFSEFAMKDSAGNKASLDGNVYTKDYRDYSFDMSFNATNFRLVNAQQSSGRLFYGSMNLDAGINVSGNMNTPKVDGDLKVNKQTNFTFVLPENDPELVNREGVVRFVDPAHPYDTLVNKAAALAAKAAGKSDIKGMDLSLNIQTDSSAIFTVIVDERNGDALTVRGRSNLVFSMDKAGTMEMTGGYEVESGAYNLSLSVLKRKFEIQRGSSITWTGNVVGATLDIAATYTANTPSLDLIANEVSGLTPTQINKFKQKLPFLVTLKMEGELLKPKITFGISLPPEVLSLWPDVDAKLQQISTQESELDKQVFALLLLNRFVGEDPLQSAAGGGVNVGNIAFQSASQILTNQLDQLAGSLIKGVDIHFDLNNQQDFSTGNEQDYTELNVSVSKRLFSDRIQVSVGSNFDVQGAGNPNQNASNIAGDAAVDYKLTKDGRYMLRAYRKNQYEAVVEGQVVETGVSFILTFDYNRFKEIFGKTREERLQERKVNRPLGGKQPNK